LITGSQGQIGKPLTKFLQNRYGVENILATDIKRVHEFGDVCFETLDVCAEDKVESLVRNFKPNVIIHLAAILSATAERYPELALRTNNLGFYNVLKAATQYKCQLYSPSTIGAFGPSIPKKNTPNETIMRPITIYGITKVYMELIGTYYHKRYRLDFRSLRYPGVVSADPPGGGTTDYIIEMYYAAVQQKPYTCFLREDTVLPMLHIDDLLTETTKYLECDEKMLRERVYNITGFSCTPKEVVEHISDYVPSFEARYQPDFRQDIADSWPESLDSSKATRDWGFKPRYTKLSDFTKELLDEVSNR